MQALRARALSPRAVPMSSVTSRSYGSLITPEPWHPAGSPDRGGRAVPAGRRDTADGCGRAGCPRPGIATLGITVGLGPAAPEQRLQVTMNDDLIIWLTKDLVS